MFGFAHLQTSPTMLFLMKRSYAITNVSCHVTSIVVVVGFDVSIGFHDDFVAIVVVFAGVYFDNSARFADNLVRYLFRYHLYVTYTM